MTWDDLQAQASAKEEEEEKEKTQAELVAAVEAFLGVADKKEDKKEEEEEEESEEEVFHEALVLLKASCDTLKGVAYLDRNGNFLTSEACLEVDMLIKRIERLTEQYQFDEAMLDGMLEVITNCEDHMLQSMYGGRGY